MHLFEKFRRDKRGSFGMMAATSSLMAVMALGTAVDITRAMNTQTKLQLMADNIGLTAAIYVKENGQQPTNRSQGFVEGALYSVDEAGGTARLPGVTGGFKVHYNQEHSRAEVTFEGELETSFMAAFNKAQIDIDVQAKVQYFESAVAATSVFLIVDNSGSMQLDDTPLNRFGVRPSGARARVDGSTATIKKFNSDLQKLISDATASGGGDRYLRTGLIPYTSSILQTKQVDPQWGALTTHHINQMQASGGTNSSSPIARAEQWMKSEDAKHLAESGTKDPVKYVIFITDGVNNSTGADTASINSCRAMTAAGVEVYAVGFALEPGTYSFNGQGGWTMPQHMSDRAYNFLESCASSPDHFIKAVNTSSLDIAFEKIGKSIAKDAIRISG